MGRPKIIYWDLETLPDPKEIYKRIPSIGAWPGRTFSADLQSVICFGYKFEGDKKARCLSAWDFTSWDKDRFDDYELVYQAYQILITADEVITHNGKQFDTKVLNTRLAYHGLPALPKVHHVDTKQVAKAGLKLYSNSLDAVAKFYNVEEKMHFSNKWDLWTRIAFKENTKKDLKLMADYCKQDVDTLQAIYKKTQSLHGNRAVNKNNFLEADALHCPSCGSDKLRSNGYRFVGNTKYRRVQCADCGSWHKLTIKEDKVSPL